MGTSNFPHAVDQRRRLLASGLGIPALSWMGPLRAQRDPPVVIGWLDGTSRARHSWARDAFHEGMAALGRKPGVQYVLEERYADGRTERLPAVGVMSSIPGRGGLFSFGHNAPAAARRSATYVDRILKGARPGDLPIEQPTVFDLVLNMKTARKLGITIAPSVRVRATTVIE